MTRFLMVALVPLIAGAASCGGSSQADGVADARVFADSAVQLLAQGKAQAVASIMHYPPTYTPEERAQDMTAVGASIDLTIHELGTISQIRPSKGAAVFYEVGWTGGDIPYLTTLSPNYRMDYVFETTYAKHGAGYIRLNVIRLTPQSPLEILGVYFGLPVTDPHSKPALVGIVRMQLARMSVSVTPDIERQIAESIQPKEYPPGSTK